MQWQEFFELHRKTILIVLGGLILLIGGWLYSKPTTTSPTFATATSSAKPADVKNESATRTARSVLTLKEQSISQVSIRWARTLVSKKPLMQLAACMPMRICVRLIWPSSYRISRSSMFQHKVNSCQAV